MYRLNGIENEGRKILFDTEVPFLPGLLEIKQFVRINNNHSNTSDSPCPRVSNECYGIKADLRDRGENYRAFAECLSALGGDLDILVTAAGIQGGIVLKIFLLKNGMRF